MQWVHVNLSGFTTDEEWNSLRCKGNIRPTSVFQIHADTRAKFGRIGINKMIKMITLTRMCITNLNNFQCSFMR